MFESKYEKQSVDRFLFVSEENLAQMKSNNIRTLGELAKHRASDLKNLGLQDDDINNIKGELGLLGLGLKN